jgi:hypothetical protein
MDLLTKKAMNDLKIELKEVTFLERLTRKMARDSSILRKSLHVYFGIYVAKNIGFESEILANRNLSHASGYFQTYFFPQKIGKSRIQTSLRLSPESEKEIELFDWIQRKSPIVIHIRVGDYLSPQNSYFGILSEEYYLDSISKFDESERKVILIVTDSVEYVKSNYRRLLALEAQITFASEYKLDTIGEFRILTYAKKLVIGNSTFSWWGGFLNCQDSTVIAPRNWFKSASTPNRIYPTEWLQVESSWC